MIQGIFRNWAILGPLQKVLFRVQPGLYGSWRPRSLVNHYRSGEDARTDEPVPW